MSAINSDAGSTVPPIPKSIVTQAPTTSMIDCRNVYKISPTKPVVPNQQQQDIVKIRITKDDSGNGFGYTKTIVTSTQSTEGNKTTSVTASKLSLSGDDDKRLAPYRQETIKNYFVKNLTDTSAGNPQRLVSNIKNVTISNKNLNFVSGKTDNKPTPQKININLAQQPTFQLKTPQNKIVFVKMMPKMPQNGPQFVASQASRSSISPTTLAVARSVQGLRPIAHVSSHSNSNVTTQKSISPEKQKSTATKELAKTESDTSLSSTLTTVTSSSSFTTTSTETENGNEQTSSPTTADDKETDQSEENQSQSIEESDQHDDHDDSASTGNVKMSREMRCLKASQSSSKILTEFMLNSASSEKLRKRCRSRGEGEDSRSCGSLTPTSQKRYSVSGREDDDLDESKGSPSSCTKRAGMRSANAEFSMKQKKFLSSIHHNSDGSDNSDNEGDRSNASKGAKKGVEMPVPPRAPKVDVEYRRKIRI